MADAPACAVRLTHSFCALHVSVLLLGCQAAAGRRAKSQKDAVSQAAKQTRAEADSSKPNPSADRQRQRMEMK